MMIRPILIRRTMKKEIQIMVLARRNKTQNPDKKTKQKYSRHTDAHRHTHTRTHLCFANPLRFAAHLRTALNHEIVQRNIALFQLVAVPLPFPDVTKTNDTIITITIITITTTAHQNSDSISP